MLCSHIFDVNVVVVRKISIIVTLKILLRLIGEVTHVDVIMAPVAIIKSVMYLREKLRLFLLVQLDFSPLSFCQCWIV